MTKEEFKEVLSEAERLKRAKLNITILEDNIKKSILIERKDFEKAFPFYKKFNKDMQIIDKETKEIILEMLSIRYFAYCNFAGEGGIFE